MGASAALWKTWGTDSWGTVELYRNEFEAAILAAIPGSKRNGEKAQRLPNTSNMYLPSIDADALVILLDQADICISSGSACLESALSPSHVILAMTGSHEVASQSIRVSLGIKTTAGEMKQLEGKIADAAKVLQ